MANSKIARPFRVKVTSGEAFEEEHSFEWKIQHFLAIKSSPELVNQQNFTFTAGNSHGCPTKWCCYLKKASDTIQVILWLKEAPPNCTAVANYMFEMIQADRTPSGPLLAVGVPFTEDDGERVVNHVPLSRDGGVAKVLIWGDGSIVIGMDIKLLIFKPADVGVVPLNKLDFEEEVNLFEYREFEKFRDSMSRMIKSGERPEAMKIIKVVSKDGVEYYANPATLSARSSVFKVMFEGGKWKEGQGSSEDGEGGSLVLEDLCGKTVNVLLNYLIVGILVKEDWKAEDVILELTWAAQKYQLEELTEFLNKVLPGINFSSEILAKLTLLTRRLGMKNAEKGLFAKLKESATDITQLMFDKKGTLLGKD